MGALAWFREKLLDILLQYRFYLHVILSLDHPYVCT